MKRIDRILSEQTNYSRKEIKKLVSKGLVLVNECVVRRSDEKYDEDNISIKINGEDVSVNKHFYLLLNKPKGYVSTTVSDSDKTVIDLVPNKYKTRTLFPAGRLDKDTTGLMLITDDGVFAHNILSPKKHIKKIYEVVIDKDVSDEMINGFKEGVKLNDGECKSALLEKVDTNKCLVTLTEGRYHQIKRMFGCYKAKVLELKRICMGELYLPTNLAVGEVREVSDEELIKIQSKK
ncbi:MAG: pseudouridine synthase [Tenericutes bacterium]|nr:pseudouridine synthase [Mycoplasmatota bacterium]